MSFVFVIVKNAKQHVCDCQGVLRQHQRANDPLIKRFRHLDSIAVNKSMDILRLNVRATPAISYEA